MSALSKSEAALPQTQPDTASKNTLFAPTVQIGTLAFRPKLKVHAGFGYHQGDCGWEHWASGVKYGSMAVVAAVSADDGAGAACRTRSGGCRPNSGSPMFPATVAL